MEFKDYTLEVYCQDRRYKTGERLVSKYDYASVDPLWMDQEVEDLKWKLYPEPKWRLVVVETYRTVINKMSGEAVRERYDTPYFCSVASEAYWSQ